MRFNTRTIKEKILLSEISKSKLVQITIRLVVSFLLYVCLVVLVTAWHVSMGDY